MAAIVGESGLAEHDRRALAFAEAFEGQFVNQGGNRRSIDETFGVGWTLLEALPRDDLTRISDATWAARHPRPAEAHGQVTGV